MTGARRRALGAAGLAAAAIAGLAVACSDINNHLLEGQEYEAAGACLTAPSVIDDLPNSDPGDNCAPECLQVPATGGGSAGVFITTTCPPYPGYGVPETADASRDAADPCTGAFAAYAAYLDGGALCTSLDGGEPEAAAEAGPDAAHGDGAAADGGDAAPDTGDAGAGDAAPADGATGG